MKKLLFMMLAIAVFAGCSKEDENKDISIENGISISEYLGKDVIDVPSDVLQLAQAVPCWEVEEVEWAKVVDGTYYISENPVNYFIGIYHSKGMAFRFGETQVAWLYYIAQKDKAIPTCEFIDFEKIKVLYYDGENMVLSTVNTADSEKYEIPVFFVKKSSQDVADEWVKLLSK